MTLNDYCLPLQVKQLIQLQRYLKYCNKTDILEHIQLADKIACNYYTNGSLIIYLLKQSKIMAIYNLSIDQGLEAQKLWAILFPLEHRDD